MKYLRCLLALLLGLVLFAAAAIAYFETPIRMPGDGRFAVLAADSLIHQGNLELSEYPEARLSGTPREIRRDADGEIWLAPPIGAAVLAVPVVAIAERSLLKRAARFLEVHDYVANRNFGSKLPAMPTPPKIQDLRPFLDGAAAAAIAAAAVVLLFWLAWLRAGWLAALVTAILLAFGTSLLTSVGKSLWPQGAALLALAAALLCLEAGRTRKVLVGIAGLPLAFAWVCGPDQLPVIFCLLLYVAFHERAQALRVLGWSLPVLLPFVLDTWLHKGVLVAPGYGFPLPEGGSYGEALLAHWFSTSRGLLVFSPFLPLAFATLAKGTRSRLFALDAWALLGALTFGAIVAFDGWWWHGHGFGARAMTPALALVTLPLALAVARGLDRARQKRPLLLGFVLALGGFAIAVHFKAAVALEPWAWCATPVSIDDQHDRLWSLTDPQVLAGFLR